MSINPYEAPQSSGEGAVESGPPLPLAGRGRRFGAKLMYWLMAGLLSLAASRLTSDSWLFQPAFGDFEQWANEIGRYYAAYLLFLLTIGAINLLLLHRSGQTIFKWLLKIRIVRYDGTEAGLSRLVFLRWLPFALCAILPCLNIAFFLCDALFIFRDDRRCLHDLLADTVVVDAVAHPPRRVSIAA